MKAKIRTQERLIAAYGLGEGKLSRLADVCDSGGIILREIPKYAAGCTAGELCSASGFAPAAACKEPPEEECLIFSGFDRDALSKTVDKLRAAGVSVALKAVLTSANSSWTLGALMEELTAEHKYMTNNGGAK
ncbi:MAG: DUF3783 domain-containing protein [Ruminococcus sp.]|nr:DUF3783 domain-containing protein [Ruminococcus sp.]